MFSTCSELTHVLPSRMVGWNELCNPVEKYGFLKRGLTVKPIFGNYILSQEAKTYKFPPAKYQYRPKEVFLRTHSPGRDTKKIFCSSIFRPLKPVLMTFWEGESITILLVCPPRIFNTFAFSFVLFVFLRGDESLSSKRLKLVYWAEWHSKYFSWIFPEIWIMRNFIPPHQD